LHDAKRWQRGKIARVIAGKLAIAARADAFGGRYIGDILEAEINKRLDEIREKYKEPPPPKEPKPRAERWEQPFRERKEAEEYPLREKPRKKSPRGGKRRRKQWRDRRAREG
jgi:nucleolar protein 56